MWSWAMAIFHRGRPVPDDAKERATKEALMYASDTKTLSRGPGAIDQRLQTLLLWGADPGGLVIPEKEYSSRGSIYYWGCT